MIAFLENSDINAAKLLKHIYSAIGVLDKDYMCLGINDTMASFYGFSKEQMLGKTIPNIFPSWKQSIFYETIERTIQTGESLQKFGYSENSKNFLALNTFKYSDNIFVFGVNFIKDNKDLLLDTNDKLTGIYNRYKYEDDVTQYVRSITNTNSIIETLHTLILIDVKNFNLINTINGTDIADMCLMEIAAKLKFNISGEDVVYRIAGDKFLVVIKGTFTNQDLLKKVKHLEWFFKNELNIKGINLKINLRFGVVLNIEGPNVVDGLKNSELALREAKRLHLDLCIYHDGLTVDVNILKMEKEIKEALHNNEFELFYQPQFNLATKTLIGMEALIRWRHKEKGLIAPNDFLPVATRFGLMGNIDKYVVQRAIKDNQLLIDNGIDVKMSINLSSDSFNIKELQDDILNMLQGTESKLCFEITETGLLSLEHSTYFIEGLKQRGHLISIDDFGTGYCSLEYLLNYSADFIKIERKFISGISSSEKNKKICENIIKLGNSLGIKVVAEGIESIDEEKILITYGCDLVQGYYYKRPISLKACIEAYGQQF